MGLGAPLQIMQTHMLYPQKTQLFRCRNSMFVYHLHSIHKKKKKKKKVSTDSISRA